MSEAFDDETTRRDSCDPQDYFLLTKNETLQAARAAALEAASDDTILIPNSIQNGDLYGDLVKEDVDWIETNKQEFEISVKDFIKTSTSDLSDDFFVKCLENEDDCVPPDTSGGPKKFIKQKRITGGRDTVKGNYLYFDCSYEFKEGKLYVQLYIGVFFCDWTGYGFAAPWDSIAGRPSGHSSVCECNSGAVALDCTEGPRLYENWNGLMYVQRYFLDSNQLPVKSLNFTKDGSNNFRGATDHGIQTAIQNEVKPKIEECYRNECGLDTKVRSHHT